MATGYTYPVAEGEITGFPQFAMSCARAFGACIEMRDDPKDAAIPEEFKPSDYHEKALAKAQNKLLDLYAMKPQQITKAAEKAFAVIQDAHEKWEAKKATENSRLKAMIAEVKAWKPPTPDHVGLKTFMLDQLSTSLHNAEPEKVPERQSDDDWYASAVERAKADVKYHSEHHARDVALAKERTEWVKSLRASLAA